MAFGDLIFYNSHSGGTKGVTGTSFAAPAMGAMIARFKQQYFEKHKRKPSFSETYNFVIANSLDIEAPGYDRLTGNGVFRLPEIPVPIKNKLSLWIGRRTAVVNGEEVTLAVIPKIENGSTLVGFRDIAQLLGKKVSFDNVEKRIDVEDGV
jgi:hypothetical protein